MTDKGKNKAVLEVSSSESDMSDNDDEIVDPFQATNVKKNVNHNAAPQVAESTPLSSSSSEAEDEGEDAPVTKKMKAEKKKPNGSTVPTPVATETAKKEGPSSSKKEAHAGPKVDSFHLTVYKKGGVSAGSYPQVWVVKLPSNEYAISTQNLTDHILKKRPSKTPSWIPADVKVNIGGYKRGVIPFSKLEKIKDSLPEGTDRGFLSALIEATKNKKDMILTSVDGNQFPTKSLYEQPNQGESHRHSRTEGNPAVQKTFKIPDITTIKWMSQALGNLQDAMEKDKSNQAAHARIFNSIISTLDN